MSTPPDQNASFRTGLLQALGAHVFWGLMPLYLVLVSAVPELEYVAWRVLFSLPVCLVILYATGSVGEIREALRDRGTVLRLTATSVLIGVNWYAYVWAIQTGQVYAASLGYYILPLVMMVLGLVVLKERLSSLQWVAVALACCGVVALAAGAFDTLWLTLALATTFAVYGLIRKTVNAGALAGLTLETLMLAPVALAIVGYYALEPQGSALAMGWGVALAVALGGPVTAIPLLLFSAAARKLPYTVVGFVQFTAPTIVFFLGLTVFGEQLRQAQLVAFIAIWAALAVFTLAMLRGRKPAKAPPQRA